MASALHDKSASVEAAIGALLDRRDLQQATTLARRSYGPQIMGYLLVMLRDESAAADVFSQFCEDFWKQLESFRRECSVKSWAYRIAWGATRRHFEDPHR